MLIADRGALRPPAAMPRRRAARPVTFQAIPHQYGSRTRRYRGLTGAMVRIAVNGQSDKKG